MFVAFGLGNIRQLAATMKALRPEVPVTDGSKTRRVLLRLTMVGAGLCPVASWSLGLGEIQVDSWLNEPLRARIEILGVSDEEWRSVGARLNWQDSLDYATVRPQVLDSVTLRPMEDISHRHFIEVKSARPMTEPLFDLPVEVAGPVTRLIRNYTVLLDPPVPGTDMTRGLGAAQVSETQPTPDAQLGSKAQPAAASQTAPASQTAVASQASGAKPSVKKAHQQPRSADAGESSQLAADRAPLIYLVKKSDTLERIARRLGAHSAAHRQQLMQWIFEHNRAAFYGDMHHLHANARLSLPETTAAPDIDASSEQVNRDLEGQLEGLQQTLQQMQETIAAQNVQIADLTAKIAARTRSAASHAEPGSVQTSQTSDTGVEEQDSHVPGRWPAFYAWAAGISAATILAIGAALLVWRRAARPVNRSSARGDAAAAAQPTQAQSPASPQVSQDWPQISPKSPPISRETRKSTGDSIEVEWHRELPDKPDWGQKLNDQQPVAPRETPLDAEKHPAAYFADLAAAYFAKRPEADSEAAVAATDSPTASLTQSALSESQVEKLLHLANAEGLTAEDLTEELLQAALAESRPNR